MTQVSFSFKFYQFAVGVQQILPLAKSAPAPPPLPDVTTDSFHIYIGDASFANTKSPFEYR
jgi:hypothetical protein